MTEKELATATDEALLQKFKQLKLYSTVTNFSLVLCVLITIARTVMDGFGYFIFLPIFIAIIAIVIGANYKAVKEEIATKD
jgi:hypothetical protein